MASFRVRVLGSDGSYPSAGGACSGYLLQTDAASVWLDAGTGTLANLQKIMAPQDLDALILTHSHADHCSNTEDLRVLFMCADRKTEQFPVYAPPGVREKLFPDAADIEPYFLWTELEDEDELDICDISLRFSKADHGPYTLAVRAENDGRSFVYSADTGPNWSMTSLGTGIDVAMIEAAHREEEEHISYHLSPRQAGEMAKDAGVDRLILTHLRPDHDRDMIAKQGEAAFGKPVELATIGAVIEV